MNDKGNKNQYLEKGEINVKVDGKVITVNDELLGAFTEGNVNTEETAAVIKAARQHESVRKVLELSGKVDEAMRTHAYESSDNDKGWYELVECNTEPERESILEYDPVEGLLAAAHGNDCQYEEYPVIDLGQVVRDPVRNFFYEGEVEANIAAQDRYYTVVELLDGHGLQYDVYRHHSTDAIIKACHENEEPFVYLSQDIRSFMEEITVGKEYMAAVSTITITPETEHAGSLVDLLKHGPKLVLFDDDIDVNKIRRHDNRDFGDIVAENKDYAIGYKSGDDHYTLLKKMTTEEASNILFKKGYSADSPFTKDYPPDMQELAARMRGNDYGIIVVPDADLGRWHGNKHGVSVGQTGHTGAPTPLVEENSSKDETESLKESVSLSDHEVSKENKQEESQEQEHSRGLRM